MANSEKEKIELSVEQATAWAENCLRINHLNTLVQREIAGGKHERATDLSERARIRAWKMFNEMIALGAKKPENYCEPDDPV
jgi:hypothetical protein